MARKSRRFGKNLKVDVETGEILFEPTGNFNMTHNKALYHILCRDKKLRGCPRAVLDYLLSQVDSKGNNLVWVEHKHMAEWMDMSEPAVSKNIHILIDAGLITQGRKMGRHIPYRFSETLFRKGEKKGKETKLPDYEAEDRRLSKKLSLQYNTSQVH